MVVSATSAPQEEEVEALLDYASASHMVWDRNHRIFCWDCHPEIGPENPIGHHSALSPFVPSPDRPLTTRPP